MASRKKQPDTQASLFGAVPEVRRLPPPEAMHGFSDQFGGEDFPAAPPPDVAEKPKLRLVPTLATIAESEVIVEKVGDVYEVSLLRRGNTTAAVFYTREQLEQLIARAAGALEVG